ncbi:MAG TPA: glycosyltransferase family 39 protein, partial [Opitutaceae bacterium]|nr:glycosyltransferase family 39 protein [Opitutaceae bacterium]
LLRMDLKFPALDQSAWRISDVWEMGFRWFYDLGNPLPDMLRQGRRMIALFGVAAGALVFFWARRLLGDRAGLLAAFLFAFCPTMLANGALITSDMTATCMFLAAVTAFWAMAHRLTAVRCILFGIVLGLLCVAKFSAPLIAPMCAILFAVRVAGKDTLESGWPFPALIAGRMRVALSLIAATLAACALAVGVIWASYGFKYPMFRHFEPNRVRSLVGWDVLEDQGGPLVPVLRFARAHELLPESYIYGFAHTYRFSRYRKAFLNGEYRSTGWVKYFPYTTAVKTPIALFALMGLAALHAASRRRGAQEWRVQLYDWSPLLSLFGVYWIFALTSHLNIGHRHIMPVYPVLFVMASGAACWVTWPLRWLGALAAALAAWFAAESVWIRPHYLAYFNEFVGPRNAWKHVVDSSLDWGQDLPAVKRWIDAHPPDGPVFISYFGSGDIVYYGVKATRVGDVNFDVRTGRRTPAIMAGGLWIIGASQFQQVYTEARGPWDPGKEARYHRLLARMVELSKSGAKMTAEDGNTFEEFQFARLCNYLRGREPLVLLDYTFLIYRLTDEEVNQALYGPVTFR